MGCSFNPGGLRIPGKGVEDEAPARFNLEPAEGVRLRLRKSVLDSAMACELLVAKRTKETARSSRAKEIFQP